MEKKLQEIGLREYESKVYLALVKHGILNARQVALYAEVPTNRVYETAEKLQNYGMVNLILGSPKKYEAIEPSIAINNFMRIKEEEHSLMKDNSNAIVKQLLKILPTQSPDGVRFWTISGSRKEVSKKEVELLELAKHTNNTIISVTKRAAMEAMILRILAEKRRKGIKVKLIYRFSKELEPFFKKLISQGDEARFYDFPLHMKWGIIDGEIGFIESTQGSEKDWFLIWTNSIPVVKLLEHYFNLIWEVSLKFDSVKKA